MNDDLSLATVAGDLLKAVREVAPEVWSTLVRQQVTYGWACMVGTVLFLLGAGGSAWAAKAWWNEDPDGPHPVAVFGVLGVLIFGVFGLRFAFDGALHLLNPEYYALKELLNR